MSTFADQITGELSTSLLPQSMCPEPDRIPKYNDFPLPEEI